MKIIGSAFLLTIACVLVAFGIVSFTDAYEAAKATQKAQAYLDSRVETLGISDPALKVEVSECVKLPTTDPSKGRTWSCLVTVTIGSVIKKDVLEFTPNNLAGKPDPVEENPALEFDHSKDNNI